MPPTTRYAKSGDVHIAYQTLGEGPLNLVYVPGWISHLELNWEQPHYTRFLNRLASFSRLILFDKRGTGMSDRVAVSELPTLEQRMDDVRAVMDAVGVERAAVFGASEGGNMSALFAATYPERTTALITYGIFARRIWAADYPWAPKPEERQARWELLDQGWSDSAFALYSLSIFAPSLAGDKQVERWWREYLRFSATPGAAVALLKMNTSIDTRHVLPTITVPTLVLQGRGDRRVKVEEGRYIAAQIPGARYVEFPGDDHLPFGDNADAIVDEVQEFLTGVRPLPHFERVLATVLFTDIVDSTAQAAALGDRRWLDLRSAHDALVRRELARFRGREVKTTGDGFLATFDGPARAIRCAQAIVDEVRRLGLEVRAGLHTGECEITDDDVGGLAVHIAARVLGQARAGEVLVTGTMKDLVAGSGISFEDRGVHRLKGIPEQWHLYAAQQGE